jgi:sodium-independent sulfate anion transporter 11
MLMKTDQSRVQAVAVMSTIVGNVVIRVQAEHPEISADNIARALALISGCVLLFLGLIRAGFLVEFIPLIAIASFMTGAALSIGVGQVPTMMGITGVNTRDPTYLVIINTLKGLPRTKLDAAMGLSALFLLYFIRYFCNFMGRKQPQKEKMWFFISTLRMAFVMILYILISWGANRYVDKASNAKFKILGTVPSGFQHKGAPNMDRKILDAIAPDIPVTILVLIIEHIAISKSFGRVNNYIINPSQELVAIGFTNVFGPFLGGYPATGSFSRTAIKAKAGVRTPLAGIFTAVIVLLALYALTSVFFFIPSASLSAIIIHAVGDLLTPPREVYNFWRVSPIEVVIFFAGVLLTVFTNIENGIYLTMAASFAVLLFRTAKSPGRFLGEVKVFSSPRDSLRGSRSEKVGSGEKKVHDAFLDFDRSEGSNPEIDIKQPHPGVFVYRFSEGFNYINSARHLDKLTIYIFSKTRRTELNRFDKIGVSFMSFFSPSYCQLLMLIAFTGPPMERPRPPARQSGRQRRDRVETAAQGHRTRLLGRELRRRHLGPGADRPAQAVRPVRGAGPGRVALCRRQQPVDQARARRVRVRIRLVCCCGFFRFR